MRILALDLSTCTGWAVLDDGIPTSYSTIEVHPDKFKLNYPYSYIECSKEIANRIMKIANNFNPNYIVIEETNKASRFTSRYSQKLLEFIHFATVDKLSPREVFYLSTSQWRKITGLGLSKSDIEKNKNIKESKDEAKFEKFLQYKVALREREKEKLATAVGKGRSLIEKEIDREAEELAKNDIKKLRLGKITTKHISVEKVNELYGMSLKLKDNDISDAILLGLGFYRIKKQHGGNNGTKYK